MFFRSLTTLAIAAVITCGSYAEARTKKSSQPAPPPPAEGEALVMIEAGCAADLPKCCYEPCIKYRHRRSRDCCTCLETAHAVLKVADPCRCCYLEVPVCIPSCPEMPCVTSKCGLFGRATVSYTWSCGYRIDIVIKKHGDVRVTYFGA